MEIYQDPIIKKYTDLITAAMPGVFKGIYQGDPIRVPASSLPALIVSKTATAMAPLTNSEDVHEMSLIVTVIVDLREEVNDDTEIVPGVAKLYDIIEGREQATYALKTDSILDILRSNIVVDAALNLRTDLGSITRADYGLTVGKRAPETYAVEGQVEFVATFSQVRE